MMTPSWNSLCRLCVTSNNCDINLCSEDDETKIMVHIILKYLSISVTATDKLPSKICQDCGSKLSLFHNFASQCLKAQSLFETHTNVTILQDDLHLRILKSEYDLEDPPIKIKHENETDSEIAMDEDADILPLNHIKQSRTKLKRSCFLKGVKKKCRRQSKVSKDERDSNKVLNELEELLEGNILDHRIKSTLSLRSVLPRVKKQQDLKEEILTDTEYFDNDNSNEIFHSAPRKMRKKRNNIETDYSIFRFTCHLCKIECQNWNALRSHVKNIHKSNPKVMCICFKLLTSRKSLLKHIAKHDPTKCFRCDSCNKIFATLKELENHVNVHLPKEELPYVCCKCAKRFTTARILKVHERTHIPREERFIWPCEFCGTKFATKGALGTHKRVIHEKLKPYVCDLCGHACSTKANLEEHRIRHGPDKNFVCDKCQKRFKTKGALVRHIDTHGDTAYQCPHCPMLLNSRRTLRNHLFVHDEKAKHVCTFCGKAFKRRKDIKGHLKLHTGERPYSCPWCPRTFTNGSNCRIHKRRMHPNEFQVAEADNPYAPAISNKNNPLKKVIHTTIKVHPSPLKTDILDESRAESEINDSINHLPGVKQFNENILLNKPTSISPTDAANRSANETVNGF